MGASSWVFCGPTTSSVRLCSRASAHPAANLVLQDAFERIFSGNRYGDVPKGVYIVRGENVVLVGEIDLDREDDVPASVAAPIPPSAMPKLLEALHAETEYKDKWEKRRTEVLRRERGFSGEGAEGDSY